MTHLYEFGYLHSAIFDYKKNYFKNADNYGGSLAQINYTYVNSPDSF